MQNKVSNAIKQIRGYYGILDDVGGKGGKFPKWREYRQSEFDRQRLMWEYTRIVSVSTMKDLIDNEKKFIICFKEISEAVVRPIEDKEEMDIIRALRNFDNGGR